MIKNKIIHKIIFFGMISLFALWQPLVAAVPDPYNLLKTQDSELNHAIQRLKDLPETKKIVQEATLSGPITIKMDYSRTMPFEALWECGRREIRIDKAQVKSFGKLLCDLLFELHNAASTSKNDILWNRAQTGNIDCDSYVRSAEKIEHENVISTVAILEAGIAKGIFPQSSRWVVVEDFETHYKIQQLVDHSLYIAQEYQEVKPPSIRSRPYIGTVPNLRFMSQNQKFAMASALFENYQRSKYLKSMQQRRESNDPFMETPREERSKSTQLRIDSNVPFIETPWEGKNP